MASPIKTLVDILNDMKLGMIAAGSRFSDFDKGSRLYALLSAVSGALSVGWVRLNEIQGLFFVSTATGTDLDRRVQDLNMQRNPGSKATGAALAFTSGSQTIPAGTLLTTSDKRSTVEVIQTKTLVPPYSALPVVSVDVGVIHNLAAGTTLFEVDGRFADVTFRVGSLGVDGLGNPVGRLTGGSNRETDEALRSRFRDYLKSLSRGTLAAVRQALGEIPGLSSLVVENAKPAPGYITINVSDGSNIVSDELRALISAKMEDWAPSGYGYMIESITRREIDVTVTAYTKDNTVSPATIQAAVAAQLTELSQNLELGHSLYRSELIRAGFVEGLENFVVTVPAVDQIAEPSELLGIGIITVNVVYV